MFRASARCGSMAAGPPVAAKRGGTPDDERLRHAPACRQGACPAFFASATQDARTGLGNGLAKTLPTFHTEPTMTPLDSPLRRQITIDDRTYTLVLGPDGLKLTEKGHRKGVELAWRDLVNGDAALASALRASVG